MIPNFTEIWLQLPHPFLMERVQLLPSRQTIVRKLKHTRTHFKARGVAADAQAFKGLKGRKPNLHVSLAPGCWPWPQGCRRSGIEFHGQNKFSSLWFEHEAYWLDLLSDIPPEASGRDDIPQEYEREGLAKRVTSPVFQLLWAQRSNESILFCNVNKSHVRNPWKT